MLVAAGRRERHPCCRSTWVTVARPDGQVRVAFRPSARVADLGSRADHGGGQAEHRGEYGGRGDRARDGWRLPSPSRGGRGGAVPAAALPGRPGGREPVRARDRADRRASVGARGFRRRGLGGLPARPAGAAAGRAARRGPAAGRGRAAGTSGGAVRRARPSADQRARVRRRGTIAAAGAHPAARHGHPAGHGAVRARRSGGAGPVPQRVPAAARAATGRHSRGSPGWGRGQPRRDRGPADRADQPRRGGHPDPADQRLRLGGDLQRGHHGGHGALPRPGAGRLPGRPQRPGRGAARAAGPQRAQERPVHHRHRRSRARPAPRLRPGRAHRAGHHPEPG